MHARSPKNHPKSRFGFTLTEVMIVMMLLAILSVFGFGNLTEFRKKQNVTNAAQKLQTTLDTARAWSMSAKKNKDAPPVPSTWGVYFYKTSNFVYELGPFTIETGPPVRLNIPSNGIKSYELPNNLTLSINWSNINSFNNRGLILLFDKLTGSTTARIVNTSHGQVLFSYDFNSSPPLQLTIEGTHWQQTVTVNDAGITELGPIERI